MHGKVTARMEQTVESGAASKKGMIVGEDGVVRPYWAASDPMLRDYYDTEWGVPVHGDAELFEQLSLEVFQAGLSWRIILAKRAALREAFSGFDPDVVAAYGKVQVEELLGRQGIIRNRQKIQATVNNAAAVVQLRACGGLSQLLWSFKPDRDNQSQEAQDAVTSCPESTALAKELRSRGFKFVGPTNMRALMEAVGIVDVRSKQ